MRVREIGIGDILENTDGIYEVTELKAKGGSICTVRECIYIDENSDDYKLGNEYYFSESEVKACFRYKEGLNIDKIVIKGER